MKAAAATATTIIAVSPIPSESDKSNLVRIAASAAAATGTGRIIAIVAITAALAATRAVLNGELCHPASHAPIHMNRASRAQASTTAGRSVTAPDMKAFDVGVPDRQPPCAREHSVGSGNRCSADRE